MRTTDEQITTEGGTPTQIESTQVQVAGRWYWPDSYAYRKVLEARIAALESREAAITVRAEPANLAAVEAWFYEWAEANVLGPREVAQFKRRLHAITARPTPANWADMLKWLGKFGSWFESVNVAGPHEIDQYVKAKPMPTAPADDNILAAHPAKPQAEAIKWQERCLKLQQRCLAVRDALNEYHRTKTQNAADELERLANGVNSPDLLELPDGFKPQAEASDMIDRALALRMAGLQQTIAELEAERETLRQALDAAREQDATAPLAELAAMRTLGGKAILNVISE